MSSLTADPGATCVPAAGFSPITLPAGSPLLYSLLTDPSANPAPATAVVAAACAIPTTLGTITVAAWPAMSPTPLRLTACATTEAARFKVLSLKYATSVR